MMDSEKLSWNLIIVKILQSSLFFWLLVCTLLLPGKADDSQIIRGVPGKDYPNFDEIPQTSFRCSKHNPGFYADPETGCQVFHHCYEHRQESFLCPLGTIFNQAILSCDYWYSADCSIATLHYGVNSPHTHKGINFDSEIEFVPVRNPSVNVFDKKASLYEVKKPVPTDSKYEFRDYSYEENHFDDDKIIVENAIMIENQEYTNNYVQVAKHHDRRDVVLVESPDKQDYFQDNLNRENIQNVADSFEESGESSGESENTEDLVFSEDHLLLSPSDKGGDIGFEEPYYTVYNNDSQKENEVQQHDHMNNEEETIHSISDFTNEQTNLPIHLVLSDKFVKRQSEDTEYLKDIRKYKRRKPLYTVVEPETSIDYLTATKKSNDKIKINANNPISDYTTFSFTEEPVTESRSLSTPTTPSRTKRRKPIMIDLEDSLQYNVHSGQNADGGTRTSSINYEVSPQSKIPGFPIAAHEISLKLFRSEVRRKRKPANAYVLDLLEHHNAGTERSAELSSVNNIGSSISNTYETSTLPTTDEMETHDVSADLNRFYPKRKKNIIHMFDFDDDHNIYIENEDNVDAITYTTDFNDETSTQSLSKESKDFSTFSDISVDYEGIKSEIDSLDSSTEQDKDSYIVIPTNNYFEISDVSDHTYFTQMNPETSFKVEEYEGESILDDKADSVNFKRLEDFDINTQDEMQDTPYFTTEFPTSEISTQMPLEIQYTEDTTSRFYFIPKASDDNFQSIPNIVLDSLDKNHGTRESFVMSDFDPNLFYQTSTESISYELLEDSKISDVSIEDAFSEVVEFQNLIKQSEEKEIGLIQTSEFEENKLNYEDGTLNENTSQNLTNIKNTLTKGEDGEFYTISNKELQENFPNENLSFEDNLDSNSTKIKQNGPSVSLIEDISSNSGFGSQYHSYDSYDSIVDMDAAKVQAAIQDGTKPIAPTDPPKLKSKHKSYISDHHIQTDILDRIDPESTEIKDNIEFEDSSETKSSINTLESTRPVINDLNEFESNPTTPSAFMSLKTQDIPNFVSHLQDNTFDPKALYKSMDRLKDASKSSIVNTVSSPKANTVNKDYSDFQQNIPRSIKNAEEESPIRSPRAFISPYQTDYNLEAFGYQNFGISPYSMLKFKQNNIKKFLPSSMYEHGFEDLAYSTRTGNILESPKISKLISIGKKLLRSKKAKLRILGKYVNSFKTDQ